MSQYKKTHFIVIDDSKLDCFIAEKIIRNTGKSESIICFHKGQDALDFIGTSKPEVSTHTIILVDIQMPIMTGFEFVEEFQKLPAEITGNYTVYVISSSINDNDLSKVNQYPAIKQFLNKPINSNNLALLIA
jgi:CheY-like chemotaxis protein